MIDRRGAAARKKWVEPLAKAPLWEALNIIERLTKREALNTLRAMESCTSANCWGAVYQASRRYRKDVEDRLASLTPRVEKR